MNRLNPITSTHTIPAVLTRWPAWRVETQNRNQSRVALASDRFVPALSVHAPQFGQKASKALPKERNGVMQTLQGVGGQFWGAFKKLVVGIFRSLEIGYDQLKMMITIGLGLMTFLPLPQRLRQFIESKFLFGPMKASNVFLIKDPKLRQKIVDSTFEMSRFQYEMEKAGFKLKFPQDDVRLSVWHIKARSNMPTVVFSHGRGGNNSHLEHVLKGISKKGFGVVVYDYPGFGQSSGSVTEEGLYQSGLATCLYVQRELKIPISQQILMGTSLGSAVSADTARRLEQVPQLSKDGKPPRALILTSTFPSLREAFIYKRERFFKPLHYIFNENKLTLRLNVLNKLKTIHKTPVLIMQGENDTDTPINMAKKMKARLSSEIQPKSEFKIIKNSPHRLRDAAYTQITDDMIRFLNQCGYTAPQSQ